jgi:hypothetical protein
MAPFDAAAAAACLLTAAADRLMAGKGILFLHRLPCFRQQLINFLFGCHIQLPRFFRAPVAA